MILVQKYSVGSNPLYMYINSEAKPETAEYAQTFFFNNYVLLLRKLIIFLKQK